MLFVTRLFGAAAKLWVEASERKRERTSCACRAKSCADTFTTRLQLVDSLGSLETELDISFESLWAVYCISISSSSPIVAVILGLRRGSSSARAYELISDRLLA